MITQKQLKEAQESFQKASEPLHKQIDEIKKNISDLSAPFLNMLEQYYDEQLQDKNGIPIKVDYYITNGKNNYLVVDRGMQFFFNEMMFNPRIMVKKLQADDSFLPKAKVKHIHPSELKLYQAIYENDSKQ